MKTEAPDAYLHESFWSQWGIWIILALILLSAASIIILLIRKKNRVSSPPLTPSEIALWDIAIVRKTNPPLKQAAVDFSLILRKYLVGETQDPALYETQQEFNRRANALTSLPTALQGTTRDLLDRMAALKYEPHTPENDTLVNELADNTVQLINEIEASTRAKQEETDIVVKKTSSRLTKS